MIFWKFGQVVSIAAGLAATTAMAEQTFQRIPTQYIAALGDPGATSGNDAETWALWAIDPGPRGVFTRDYAALVSNANTAPDGWTFDPSAWWVEEYGRIMERPVFPLPAGKYVVTGGREVTSLLIVSAPDAEGHQAWTLADGADIYDVTHLRCRAALYTPATPGASCTPDQMPTQSFPVTPGLAMPSVQGCSKQDYQVLIVVGMVVES